MKSAIEVGIKLKSTMEVSIEVEEANELIMKTTMEIPTEWICKEAEMICVIEVAIHAKSTVNVNHP